jgi:Tol biopolymer transport system component
MDAAGGNIRRLTDHEKTDSHPAWAPNGRHIAFTSSRHEPGKGNPKAIYVMDADGSNVRRLTMMISSEYASWAPGGGRIAF